MQDIINPQLEQKIRNRQVTSNIINFLNHLLVLLTHVLVQSLDILLILLSFLQQLLVVVNYQFHRR